MSLFGTINRHFSLRAALCQTKAQPLDSWTVTVWVIFRLPTGAYASSGP
jgi:hypothetical protein